VYELEDIFHQKESRYRRTGSMHPRCAQFSRKASSTCSEKLSPPSSASSTTGLTPMSKELSPSHPYPIKTIYGQPNSMSLSSIPQPSIFPSPYNCAFPGHVQQLSHRISNSILLKKDSELKSTSSLRKFSVETSSGLFLHKPIPVMVVSE
jgi:hypothetical protein